MQTTTLTTTTIPSTPSASESPFARAVRASKRARFEIERDVIQDRTLDTAHDFLPDGLSLVHRMRSLSPEEKRFLSHVQGRTYANIFGLVERFINAKVLELSRDYVLGDQVALEGLVRFSDEELKHQELFRRVEQLAGDVMPPGYTFLPDPDEVAKVVLGKSTWSVLALTLHIELFTQKHYRESMEPNPHLSPLFKDVFLYHWKEEAQHAVMDEIELRRCNAKLSPGERDQAVTDFIDLVVAVDGILQLQAEADTRYFVEARGRDTNSVEREGIARDVLSAYRWQYILSGAEHPHFLSVLTELITLPQAKRVMDALATLR